MQGTRRGLSSSGQPLAGASCAPHLPSFQPLQLCGSEVAVTPLQRVLLLLVSLQMFNK